MAARQQRSGKIDRVDRLEQKQSRRGPRKDQRALQPQANSDQHISQVTKEKKILQPVLPPVHGRPDDQPDGPPDLEPQRQARGHGPLLYATAASPLVLLRFKPKRHKNPRNANYQRNLLGLTGVPTMVLVWVTKLFSSVPMKRPPAR